MLELNMVYELRNKVPQNSSFIHSENVLTATIFGNLRYFSNQEILINFLNQSVDLSEEYLLLEDEKYAINFWEKYTTKDNNKINEPDLILLNKNNVILIECKYFSFLSEDGDINNKETYDNQLIRYSNIIEEYFNAIPNKIIIYLTNDKIKPIDLLNITLRNINPEIKLFWLSWLKLYKCMKNYNFHKLSNGEMQLYYDIMNFMTKRNLTGFCGFETVDSCYDKFYHKVYCFSRLELKNIRWRFKNE